MQPVLVPVESSQFWLCEPDRQFGTPRQPINGLVAAAIPGTAIVYTGISSGWVSVLAQALTAAPAAFDLDKWDEVAEISLPGLTGELTVTALMDPSHPDCPTCARPVPATTGYASTPAAGTSTQTWPSTLRTRSTSCCAGQP